MNIQIVDTFNQIKEYKETNSRFSLEAYEIYASKISLSLYKKCFDDVSKYNLDTDVIPVIHDALYEHFDRIETAHKTITRISPLLSEKISKLFNIPLDIIIIFYLGLCNGAGWATTLDGKNVILLGAEKIAELEWHNEDTISDLICHEAAHLIHFELRNNLPKPCESIWQLYVEGFATRVSQLLYKEGFYHQNQNGWLEFCQRNTEIIKKEYRKHLINAENDVSCFFGDWNTFMDHSNLGYYLGCEFIRELEKRYTMQNIALLSANEIEKELMLFLIDA